MSKAKYDSSVARMAGNIAAGYPRTQHLSDVVLAEWAKEVVRFARAIVAEVQRTEPAATPDLCGNKGYANGDRIRCTMALGHALLCFDPYEIVAEKS